MTVEELIEILKKYPPDMPVYINKQFDEYDYMLAVEVKKGCLNLYREFTYENSEPADDDDTPIDCVIITDCPD